MSESPSYDIPSDDDSCEDVGSLAMFNWVKIFCDKLGLSRWCGRLGGMKWLGNDSGSQGTMVFVGAVTWMAGLAGHLGWAKGNFN